MEPEPAEIAALVFGLVEGPWPTSEDERVVWFADHGLPRNGQPVLDLDQRMPTSRHFEADGPSGWGKTSWSLRQGQFVGLSWFFWTEADESRTAAAAESLRTLFDDAWA